MSLNKGTKDSQSWGSSISWILQNTICQSYSLVRPEHRINLVSYLTLWRKTINSVFLLLLSDVTLFFQTNNCMSNFITESWAWRTLQRVMWLILLCGNRMGSLSETPEFYLGHLSVFCLSHLTLLNQSVYSCTIDQLWLRQTAAGRIKRDNICENMYLTAWHVLDIQYTLPYFISLCFCNPRFPLRNSQKS